TGATQPVLSSRRLTPGSRVGSASEAGLQAFDYKRLSTEHYWIIGQMSRILLRSVSKTSGLRSTPLPPVSVPRGGALRRSDSSPEIARARTMQALALRRSHASRKTGCSIELQRGGWALYPDGGG